MSTAKAQNPMGLKRICNGCGARFYDLNKRPIICPSCGVEFTGEVKVKGRRGRTAAVAEEKVVEKVEAVAVEKEDDEILEEDEGVEVVSLDDVETTDEKNEDDSPALAEENLDDIPDFEGELEADIGDDDTLLDDDED